MRGRPASAGAGRPYELVAEVVAAFDRPCIPADCVAMGAHTPGMLPTRALSGGRRNGLDAHGTFTTGCYEMRANSTSVTFFRAFSM